ncbi:MAG: energy-coupling factor ABC transporter ATP-binding protein [Pigmentiphaga sp.]|nr:energy-coupling factor ABC transporter ATP-binding protein [Pigmentiphaga sp.]
MSSLSTPVSPGIHLQRVDLLQQGKPFFKQLDLALTEHRIGIIGDNGAGKSTLFRLIAGLELPDGGKVWVHGHETTDPKKMLPSVLGVMFQNPDDQIIFPTVLEELAFTLNAQGTPRRQARALAEIFLIEQGWGALKDRAVHSLSQGQRQYVCWLSLKIAQPRTLLLDEPFSSLDLPGQILLRRQIDQAPQQIIIASHQLEPLQPLERVIWLHEGKVHLDGDGESVCAAYLADLPRRLESRSLLTL